MLFWVPYNCACVLYFCINYFALVQRNWACFIRKGVLEIRSSSSSSSLVVVVVVVVVVVAVVVVVVVVVVVAVVVLSSSSSSLSLLKGASCVVPVETEKLTYRFFHTLLMKQVAWLLWERRVGRGLCVKVWQHASVRRGKGVMISLWTLVCCQWAWYSLIFSSWR